MPTKTATKQFEEFKRKIDKSPDRDLKTINIKGKEYTMVHERIKAFREWFGTFGAIETVTESYDPDQVLIRANIYIYLSDENGDYKLNAITGEPIRIKVATGTGQEFRTKSGILATSYVEVAETSAIGRALGFNGIGIDNGIASAEEVRTAINTQKYYDTNSGDTTHVANQIIAGTNTQQQTPWSQPQQAAPSAQPQQTPPWQTQPQQQPQQHPQVAPAAQAPAPIQQQSSMQQSASSHDQWMTWMAQIDQIQDATQIAPMLTEIRKQVSDSPNDIRRYEEEIRPYGLQKYGKLTGNNINF